MFKERAKSDDKAFDKCSRSSIATISRDDVFLEDGDTETEALIR